MTPGFPYLGQSSTLGVCLNSFLRSPHPWIPTQEPLSFVRPCVIVLLVQFPSKEPRQRGKDYCGPSCRPGFVYRQSLATVMGSPYYTMDPNTGFPAGFPVPAQSPQNQMSFYPNSMPQFPQSKTPSQQQHSFGAIPMQPGGPGGMMPSGFPQSSGTCTPRSLLSLSRMPPLVSSWCSHGVAQPARQAGLNASAPLYERFARGVSAWGCVLLTWDSLSEVGRMGDR